MPKATITTLAQTDSNGLFSLTFEGEALSEYEKFIERFKGEADQFCKIKMFIVVIN